MPGRIASADFHSLKRRDLQALCKINKIPANITNVAMANALQSLETVEGLEELLKQHESEATESPEDSAITTPLALRSSNRQRSTKKEPDSSKPIIRTCRGSSRRVIIEETDQERNDLSQTSAAAPKTRRRGLPVGSLQKMEIETPRTKGKGVEMQVYSTRRSARLLERKMRDLSLEEESLQREFVESLQTTEDGDGFSETGGVPEGESKAISEVSLVGSCEKLDDLAKGEKELQDSDQELDSSIGFEADHFNLTLEEAPIVLDVDRAEDANMVFGSKIRAEPDSLELFTLLNETLKSVEESNLNLGKGKNVPGVLNQDEAGNADIEVDSNSEDLSCDSKELLDAQNQAVSEKADEACGELKMSPAAAISYDDPKEENKGVDYAQEGSTFSIQINSAGDAISEKLEEDGVNASEGENPSEHELQITLADTKATRCESQPCGAQKSDIVEGDSSSDETQTFDLEDSVDGGMFNDVEEGENGVRAVSTVMNPKTAGEIQLGEADCVSCVSEDISEDGSAEQLNLYSDPVYVTPEKGVDAGENFNACEGNEQSAFVIKQEICDSKERESCEAINEYSRADIAVSTGSVAVPSREFDDQKGKCVEDGPSLGTAEKQMIEACNPFKQMTWTENGVSDNDSSSEAVVDLELEMESLTLDPITATPLKSSSLPLDSTSARRNTTRSLENNKENIIVDMPMPGAKKIDSTESGTPLEKRSLRRLKKEIRKLEEKNRRQALQSVSDNCMTTES